MSLAKAKIYYQQTPVSDRRTSNILSLHSSNELHVEPCPQLSLNKKPGRKTGKPRKTLQVLSLTLGLLLPFAIFDHKTASSLTQSEFLQQVEQLNIESMKIPSFSQELDESADKAFSAAAAANTEKMLDRIANQASLSFMRNATERYAEDQALGRYQAKLTDSNVVSFIAGIIVVFHPGTEAAGDIASEVLRLSREHDIEPLFIASVIASESGFRKKARSSVGARGLMQLMPRTAKSLLDSVSNETLHESTTNIDLGIRYLKQLLESYDGNANHALAAYNWGPTNLNKALRGKKRIPKSVQHYAKSIIKRSDAWQSHFEQTSDMSATLAVVSAKAGSKKEAS